MLPEESSQDKVRDPRQVLARPTGVADRWVRCDRSQWSGKYLGRAFRLSNGNFGLFGLANTQISVCSVSPVPILRSVRSGQYPYFGLFGLAKTNISLCSVWPIPFFCLSGSQEKVNLRPTCDYLFFMSTNVPMFIHTTYLFILSPVLKKDETERHLCLAHFLGHRGQTHHVFSSTKTMNRGEFTVLFCARGASFSCLPFPIWWEQGMSCSHRKGSISTMIL